MIWRRTVAASVLALIGASTHPAGGQYQTRTRLRWRTVETEHFSVHYPSDLETWGRSVASKMEGVESAVRRIVGYTPQHRVHIIVDDPFRTSNGSAWPFIDAPALIFWATPPNPREDVGTYLTWVDMLSSHEFAHLAHLTRPSRNTRLQALWDLLPLDLGPIGRKVPRWVTEGYATYVEGIVTGSGRPHGSWRPTILRQWAIEGHLPSYDQLSGTGGMYGGEFAYLGGSAFIEWLAARRGDSSLVYLWRRLSARKDRGFNEAFTGVYGESPAVLYGRFTTDVTANALEIKRSMAAAGPDSGRVIQHLSGETGDPAISRDGGRAAILIDPPGKRPRVVVWSTAPEPDTGAERARTELVARDPEDVPAISVFPPPKKAIATLYAVGNQSYQGPRFFRDGRLLLWRLAAVGDGSYSPDLFIWDPQRHVADRVTTSANVREGDPSPDGLTAAALQCASGQCDLVLVDIRSGRVSTLAVGSETRSFYRPRFSPDGHWILASVHDGGRWQLAMISVANGTLAFVTTGPNAYDASFVDDSSIVATMELSKIPTLVRIGAGHVVQPLAHTTGAAVGAEVNPADRSVWFLALHARGWDVRSVPLDQPNTNRDTALATFGELKDTTTANGLELPRNTVGLSHEYGFGPRKWIYLPGTASSDRGTSLIVALVNSDIVGRHEFLLQWQGGSDESWQGTSATITSRANRVPWTVSGFTVRQAGRARISTVLHGGEFTFDASDRRETSTRRLTVGGTVADLQTNAGPGGLRALGFGTTTFGATRYGDSTKVSFQVSMDGTAGRSGGADVSRGTVTATLEAGLDPLILTGTAGAVHTTSDFEQFTIGGLAPVLLQPSALSQRIAMPVLPATYASGKSLLMYRLSIPLASARGYWWSAKVGNDSASRWEHVRGIEWTAMIPQISVIGTPAARITGGIGNWSNGPRAQPVLVGGTPYYRRERSLTQLYIVTQFGDWVR